MIRSNYSCIIYNKEISDLKSENVFHIKSSTEHFKALENGVEMRIAKDWKEFKVQH